jgi:hypothetical protein
MHSHQSPSTKVIRVLSAATATARGKVVLALVSVAVVVTGLAIVTTSAVSASPRNHCDRKHCNNKTVAGHGSSAHNTRAPQTESDSPDPVSSSATPTLSVSIVAPTTSATVPSSVPAPKTTTKSVAPPAPVPVAAAGGIWHPAPGTTWQWQLDDDNGIDLSYSVGAYDIDGVDATAATVAAIHAKGAKAICYIETGSWENYRPDASSYPASVLGNSMGGYPDERYVDIRQIGILEPIIDARLDMCKSKGFDAIEPDIDDSVVDVGAQGIGFPDTFADQIAFNTMVANDAHARGLAIALKNGTFGDDPAPFVDAMEPITDFAINEECYASGNVCSDLETFITHGKAVFHTEYLSDYSGSSETNYQSTLDKFCPVTKGQLGFSSILKDSSDTLSAWRESC